ncbi:MAG: hypothetical protein ACI84E_002471 [Planctomycetota bacterium]|jgi:hypothetical protein
MKLTLRPLLVLAVAATSLLTTACDPGSMRMFADSFDEANGYEVIYYDQSNVDYIGEVRNTYGVRNGEGFNEYDNQGSDYYKIRAWFEDGSSSLYFLEPYETTGRMSMSLYNQVDSTDAIYGDYPGIFDESMD